MNYKIIDDLRVIEFYKNHTDRRYKRISGIKFPKFGKNRGKLLIPEGMWGKISEAYIFTGGDLPKGAKITARFLTETELGN